ncbi:MAG: hypothetical protein ACU843_12835 [Gammaproteobacteria bacterium]
MIRFIAPHSAGNAITVLLQPPSGATDWRLLRKDSDSFSGESDPNATVIATHPEKSIIDTGALNGTEYWYQPYYFVGGAWVTDSSASATAASSFVDASCDPYDIVRERLDLGMKDILAQGNLDHDLGRIPVLTASPLVEETTFPVISMHVTADEPMDRGIGDIVYEDESVNQEGWLARMQIEIVGWCLNADERKNMRSAIKQILQANLGVFDSKNIQQIEFSVSDQDDFQTYGTPMFMARCTFRCIYPNVAEAPAPIITQVNQDISVLNNG